MEVGEPSAGNTTDQPARVAVVNGDRVDRLERKDSTFKDNSNEGKKQSIQTEFRKSNVVKDGSKKYSAWDKEFDLDEVLINELGQFGRFQLLNTLLIALPLLLAAVMSEYIFSAAAIPHRCQVPECGEDSKNVEFEPEWIMNAIPASGSDFSSCERFAPVGGNGTQNYCPATLFDQNIRIECDGFVYSRDNSVVYDFDLGCEEWLRALAGTLSSVGTLLVLPITGYVSDRWGRRVALTINVFNLGLFGLLKAFSVNYPMYLALQLLQTTLGAGTFSSAYVFAAEMVGPKWCVLMSAFASSMFAVGQVSLGLVSWAVQPWRYMIITIHIPCFFIVSYYWFLPESIRWLLSKRKFDKAQKVLEQVAKTNNKKISEKSIYALLHPYQASVPEGEVERPGLLKAIIGSPIMFRRVCTTPVWWITTTFVFYGLSLNSTGLSGNMYLNYVLACLIEIPGYALAWQLLDRVGRKPTLTGGFLFSAVCNMGFAFIPADFETLRMVLYLLGKFGISVVFTSLYLYTSELYPTEYRHTLLAFSSMIGRIGSITAPLTPVWMIYWEGIPSVMFGTFSLISGLLVLTQPETVGLGLPDTLAEAEAIGRTPKE